jgi:hypothetical protein
VLKGNRTYSCGCKSGRKPLEIGKVLKNGTVFHGMKGTPEYSAWGAMKGRCSNPKYDNYHNYGGRGITVCEEWSNSFTQFFKDLGPRPEGCSLDRIDVDGNYEPGNVRWGTEEEQCNNRTNAQMITHNSKTQTIAQWARETGLSTGLLYSRLYRGWPPEMILDPFISNERTHVKLSRRARLVTHNGKTQTISAWAKERGMAYSCLLYRLDNGWDVARALEL